MRCPSVRRLVWLETLQAQTWPGARTKTEIGTLSAVLCSDLFSQWSDRDQIRLRQRRHSSSKTPPYPCCWARRRGRRNTNTRQTSWWEGGTGNEVFEISVVNVAIIHAIKHNRKLIQLYIKPLLLVLMDNTFPLCSGIVFVEGCDGMCKFFFLFVFTLRTH